MNARETELDRYIDALNAGLAPHDSGGQDPELASLFATVRRMYRLQGWAAPAAARVGELSGAPRSTRRSVWSGVLTGSARYAAATAVVLLVLAFAGALALAVVGMRGGIPRATTSYAAPVGAPEVAYAVGPGAVVKVDAASGVPLARWPLPGGVPGTSLAVSHDGQLVFVLNVDWDGQADHDAVDRLHVLSGDTLVEQLSLPAEDFARAGNPPALAATSDDRTVVVYHAGRRSSEAGFWLTYFDRRTASFSADHTPLPGCDGARLLPLSGSQLAVVCTATNDVRLVDAAAHKVVGTTALGQPRARNLPGWVVAADVIPESATLAVVLDNARVVRVDPARQTVTPIAELAADDSQVVPAYGAAFSPSGRAVVALAKDGDERSTGAGSTLVVVDISSGKVLDRFAQPVYLGIALSPDGKRAFVRAPGRSGHLQAIDLATHGVQDFSDGTPLLKFR
jgi:DNA-binding beta-propeller fold protein YncE